ncbi:MAG TPA: LytR C-terminal domain-containing protein [Solirubrobacterales bacterium]|nr:LytR C-terminal domain-containing protein [Solirubrobacterales bacterium]
MELIKEIGAFAGLVAFLGLALLALLSFAQGRDIRRLREWAGSAPERDAERKDSTSAAAQERAEEMRKLEEARDAERRAAELRETRRQRREAGLPELTRSERLRERFGGHGGHGIGSRLGEPRYLAAIFAALLLVAGVVAYGTLHGFGDSDSDSAKGKQASAKLKPGEIEVTVLNGTSVEGLAGSYGDMVERKGFQLGAVDNSRSTFAESIVMFKPGNGRSAHSVATALQVPRVRAMTGEIASRAAGAPVVVVIGEDNAASAG